MPLILIAIGVGTGAALFGKEAGEGLGETFKTAAIAAAIAYVAVQVSRTVIAK